MSNLDKQFRELEKKLNKISKLETDRAYASAANKLTALVKTEVSRKVSKEINLPVRLVKQRIYISRANARKGRSTMSLYTRPINAIHTNFRKLRKGYKVAGEFKPRSFMAKGRAPRHLIFQREGKANYPIDVVKVRIQQSVDTHTLPVFKARMARDFQRLLRHEFNARINRYV